MWHLFLFFFWISTRMRSNPSWSYIWIFCVNSLDFIKVESKYQFQKSLKYETPKFSHVSLDHSFCIHWQIIIYLPILISVFPITEHNYKNWEQFFVDFFGLWYFRLCGTCTYIFTSKVHIFWEGHKILRNLHDRFDRYYIGQIYGGDFAKICGLLRIYELYQYMHSLKIEFHGLLLFFIPLFPLPVASWCKVIDSTRNWVTSTLGPWKIQGSILFG